MMWLRRLRKKHVDPLLSGDIPEGREDLAALERVVEDIRSLASTSPPEGARATTVAAAAAEAARLSEVATPAASAPPSRTGRIRWAARGLASGVAAKIVLGTAVAVAGTAGAAAAGILPGPVQRFVERTADVVGLDFAERTTTTVTSLPDVTTTTEAFPSSTTTLPEETTTTTAPPAETTTTTTLPPPPVAAVEVVRVGDPVYEPGGVFSWDVLVTNTGESPATVASLEHSRYGDLLAGGVGLRENTCTGEPRLLGAGEGFSCRITAFVSGESGEPIEDTVTALLEAEGVEPTAVTTSFVYSLSNSPADVATAFLPGSTEVPETGQDVEYTATITNLSFEPVALVSLSDSVFGDLLDGANSGVSNNTCALLGAVLEPEESVSCEFTGFVSGSTAEGRFRSTLRVEVRDDEEVEASARETVRIRLLDQKPDVTLTKSSSSTLLESENDIVTFFVIAENNTGEALSVDLLYDGALGNLLDPDNPNLLASTCLGMSVIEPFGSVNCSYAVRGTQPIGDPDHHHHATIYVSDDEGNSTTASDWTLVASGVSNTRVSGWVFSDLDGDGQRGQDEPGIAGVEILVVSESGWSITVTTDATGYWSTPVFGGNATVTVLGPSPELTLTTGNAVQQVTAETGVDTPTGPVGFMPPSTTPPTTIP